ncbi:hypothetical protein, partial [Escherichia coli]
DRNRSHWSTSKTPSYTKSVSWQHHPGGHHKAEQPSGYKYFRRALIKDIQLLRRKIKESHGRKKKR